MSGDHPEWGEDRIAEELAAKFRIEHSASTIRRYMVPRQGPPRGTQTWRTFARNHSKEVRACDFLTQYTALFVDRGRYRPLRLSRLCPTAYPLPVNASRLASPRDSRITRFRLVTDLGRAGFDTCRVPNKVSS
jgi:hypothetical protein